MRYVLNFNPAQFHCGFTNGPGNPVSIPGRVLSKMIPPCLTLSIIRFVSRVSWNNPGNGVVPAPTPQCSSY